MEPWEDCYCAGCRGFWIEDPGDIWTRHDCPCECHKGDRVGKRSIVHADVPDRHIPQYMVLLEAPDGETSLVAFMNEQEMEEWLKESTWKVLHTYEWNVESASWWDVDWED